MALILTISDFSLYDLLHLIIKKGSRIFTSTVLTINRIGVGVAFFGKKKLATTVTLAV
jgi:hypothetical protein